MAKTGQEIVQEQLGALTFQLCMMDAERAVLREENAALKAELAALKGNGLDRPVPGQIEPKEGVKNGQ